MPYANQEIRSVANKRKIYAKKGDKLRIVSQHGPLVCCEDMRGNRFPTKKEYLTESRE